MTDVCSFQLIVYSRYTQLALIPPRLNSETEEVPHWALEDLESCLQSPVLPYLLSCYSWGAALGTTSVLL